MTTDTARLAVVARAIRLSLAQLLQHVDDLTSVIENGAQASGGPSGASVAPPTAVHIDRRDFTVQWAGACCHLGHTLSFRLMCEFARRPNQYLPVEELLDEVWGGTRTPSAVRSAVSELRSRLIAGGLGTLAGCIDGRNPGHYGLMLLPR